jgi:hypothetical protein
MVKTILIDLKRPVATKRSSRWDLGFLLVDYQKVVPMGLGFLSLDYCLAPHLVRCKTNKSSPSRKSFESCSRQSRQKPLAIPIYG